MAKRALTWAEVDFEARVWAVEPGRKPRIVHRVALSQRVLEILSAQRVQHPETDLVFPSVRGLVHSEMVLTKFLRDQNAPSNEPGRIARPRTASAPPSAIGRRRMATPAISPTALSRTRSRTKWRLLTIVPTLLEQQRATMYAWSAHVEERVKAWARMIHIPTARCEPDELHPPAASAATI